MRLAGLVQRGCSDLMEGVRGYREDRQTNVGHVDTCLVCWEHGSWVLLRCHFRLLSMAGPEKCEPPMVRWLLVKCSYQHDPLLWYTVIRVTAPVASQLAGVTRIGTVGK